MSRALSGLLPTEPQPHADGSKAEENASGGLRNGSGAAKVEIDKANGFIIPDPAGDCRWIGGVPIGIGIRVALEAIGETTSIREAVRGDGGKIDVVVV